MSSISELVRTRRYLHDSVRHLSESLGATPAAVACRLAELHVVGRPKCLNQCVVARYLWAIVGSEQSVKAISVSAKSIHVTCSDGHVPLRVSLPRPISKFIRGFDEGSYPELVDPRYRKAADPAMAPGSDPAHC